MRRHRLTVALVFLFVSSAVCAQRTHQTDVGQQDVIVTGLQQREYPVRTAPTDSLRSEALYSEQASANAQHFGKCVKPKNGQLLHQLIDGLPNRHGRINALDRLIRENISCYPGSRVFSISGEETYGDCNPRGLFKPILDFRSHHIVGGEPVDTVCQAFFDRGAIVERVISLYAPNISLDSLELDDPQVVVRYLKRESRFDSARSEKERLSAITVGCLVEGHPEIALALLKTGAGTAAEAKYRNALVGLTPACAGGAKVVKVDPSQFRVFVADSVYSWVVAVRDTPSLIPLN